VRVLIADDEPIARQILREHVEAIPALEVAGEASTGAEALARIFDLDPDLVLLDLQMPELDGLSVVRALRGGRAPLIIFVTAFERHALEAFEVGAIDYLLKPVRRERLEKAVLKARRQMQGAAGAMVYPRTRKIAGRRGTDLFLLDPSEIVAFEAEGEVVHIITTTQRYFSDDSLKALELTLERRFRRVHRHTIVNTDHIRRISPLSSKRWLLTMSNGFEAVVSKRLARSVREHTRW
jgi:DNA-binding LytR/AlgR family response regulator